VNLVTHPLPPISLDEGEPDPMAVIAAGIGSWRVQNIATVNAGYPRGANRLWFANAIIEAATQLDPAAMNKWLDGDDSTRKAIAATHKCLTSDIADILHDLPSPIWERVVMELDDCNPKHAFNIIAIHQNVVTTLTKPVVPTKFALAYDYADIAVNAAD